MRPEELRTRLRCQPSVPIRIHCRDETAYDVKHPEMAMLTRSTIEIGLEEQEGSGIVDNVVHCSLEQIGRVENLNGQ